MVKTKKNVFGGAGAICQQWLASGFDGLVELIIDNSLENEAVK